VVGGIGDASAWDIVVNARAYPLGFFGDLGDFFIKPYAIVGIGGGQSKLKAFTTTSTDGAFVANFGAGADVMLGDHLGLYGEVAYKLYASNQIDGITNLNLGVVFKF